MERLSGVNTLEGELSVGGISDWLLSSGVLLLSSKFSDIGVCFGLS